MTKFVENNSPVRDPILEATASDASVMAVLRLRYWQHLLNEMLKEKQFRIPIHLGFGHEAAAVALDYCMATEDKLCLTHRNAAYNLARIKSLDAILQHYRLEEFSPVGGLMGSMNLAADGSDIAYTSSILGNNLPVAAGMAMNRLVMGKVGVVFVLTGDGAMEEGSFWETLVFSCSHHLPLVIVVENNDHSMSSTIQQRRCNINIDQISKGIGIKYFSASGAIVGDSIAALSQARASAESGNPACVELRLSTFCQHAGPTPGWPDDPLRIAIKDGLLVQDSPADPVYHVREALGADKYLSVSREFLKAD